MRILNGTPCIFQFFECYIVVSKFEAVDNSFQFTTCKRNMPVELQPVGFKIMHPFHGLDPEHKSHTMLCSDNTVVILHVGIELVINKSTDHAYNLDIVHFVLEQFFGCKTI